MREMRELCRHFGVQKAFENFRPEGVVKKILDPVIWETKKPEINSFCIANV